MTRVPDWQTKLADFIHSRLRTPFAWGSQDCALFACDCVKLMTEVDLAEDFRGKYTDARSAIAVIRNYAAGAIDALAEKKAAEFGLPAIDVNMASRGDVVLILQDTDPENMLALGIVGMDGRSAACAGPDGLRFVPRSSWLKAWKI